MGQTKRSNNNKRKNATMKQKGGKEYCIRMTHQNFRQAAARLVKKLSNKYGGFEKLKTKLWLGQIYNSDMLVQCYGRKGGNGVCQGVIIKCTDNHKIYTIFTRKEEFDF